jgi:hypothetical protein
LYRSELGKNIRYVYYHFHLIEIGRLASQQPYRYLPEGMRIADPGVG